MTRFESIFFFFYVLMKNLDSPDNEHYTELRSAFDLFHKLSRKNTQKDVYRYNSTTLQQHEKISLEKLCTMETI